MEGKENKKKLNEPPHTLPHPAINDNNDNNFLLSRKLKYKLPPASSFSTFSFRFFFIYYFSSFINNLNLFLPAPNRTEPEIKKKNETNFFFLYGKRHHFPRKTKNA